MVKNLVLQADRLQAELIVSDIPHSCKAYLHKLTRIGPESGSSGEPEPLDDAVSELIATARRLAETLGGKTLLAGFRPDGPVPDRTPDNPPAGMHPYTSFVRLTAATAALAAQRTDADPPLFRRVRLTPERVAEFLQLHHAGMADVPNVPVLSEEDVRGMMAENRVELIELAEGPAIGFLNISAADADPADPAVSIEPAVSAELDEIAVLPAWRSRGIGRAVIIELAGELAAAGIRTLSVLVATANPGALRLYESLGFASPEIYSHWFQMPVSRRERVAPMHSAADLTADLQRLGVRRGETLMVHTALNSLGWVPGGAVALIDALTEALGPEGTLVMAAHSGENSEPANWVAPPVPAEWWPKIRETIPAYHPDITPTHRIGAVPEVFRSLPGVLRSAHPSYSFTARGAQAAAIVAEHPLAEALGVPSPCCRLVDLDARILQIGTHYDTCTVMHLGEYLANCRLRIRQGAATLVDGRRQWVSYTDAHGNSDEFFEPGRLLESRGQVQSGKVGEADCRLFRAADAVDAARDWFRAHRMRRLGEADRGWLLELLSREPEFNLFLIGDIENHGFEAPFQDILAFPRPRTADDPTSSAAPAAPPAVPAAPDAPAESSRSIGSAAPADPPAIDSIVLRYDTHFIVYSEHNGFALAPVLSALDYPTLSMLSAKKSIMERLRPHLPGYTFSDTFMMKRPTAAASASAGPMPAGGGNDGRPVPENSDAAIELATRDDIPELAAFVYGIAEFAVADQSLEDRAASLRRSLTQGGSRYVLIRENGRIVACAGTTAENSQSAMVVSVATDPAFRRRGFATRLVSRLCGLHAREGREFLCLFYSNPAAGVIYRGLGFTEIGTWVMARPPVRIPGQSV